MNIQHCFLGAICHFAKQWQLALIELGNFLSVLGTHRYR